MQRKIDQWSASLQSQSPERQSEALREVAAAEEVSGIALACVSLAGSRHDEVRQRAAEALESTVQPTPIDLPGLIELLDAGRDSEISYWSATLLGRLGPVATPAVETLARCAAESNYLAARERAVWALGQLGPCAASATPVLRQIAADAPPRLRELASETLESTVRHAA